MELKAIEIKSGTTINNVFFSNLEKFEKLSDSPVSKLVIYGGDKSQKLKGTTILPWRELKNTLNS